ncbi:MAG TPA: type I polyketide synthase, partial [bacterium]|nr:type I polyketide synthase [bacterium]
AASGTDRVAALFDLLGTLSRNGWSVDPSILLDRRRSVWIPSEPPEAGGIPCHPVHDRPPLPKPGIGTDRRPDLPLMDVPAMALRDTGDPALPPPVKLARQIDRTATAVTRAQAQYLELNRAWTESLQHLIAVQMQLVNTFGVAVSAPDPSKPDPHPGAAGSPSPVFMDRHRCLEFARGSVAAVLGPAFAEADGFPTRVRLPDEPLMLVDRILRVDGTAKSMTHGRVVTEHDVLPGAWYLDQGKCPVCIAVEAGQADLFLSGYLGIDFETRGIQKYRLLDADITMHRGLPEPGETVRYDIRITRFFRQGGIWLFHFEYDATIAGMPMLTMRNGCAGFFSDRELDEGRGIVKPRLDAGPSKRNDGGAERGVADSKIPERRDHVFTSGTGAETYTAAQLDALRRGDLAACFGEEFKNLSLKNPPVLPGGRMHLIDRITELNPSGGPCGLGYVRAEADIDPEAWFLTCHFIDDMVMPGTLMYECCFHAFRVLLMRNGWLGEADRFAWDPRPGVVSRLKCRGQVIPSTRKAAYEITVREIGFDPAPWAVADALMIADGRPVVEIHGMSVQLTGLTRDGMAALWHPAGTETEPTQPRVLYDKQSILAFSNGKPSDAFGEPYSMFDGDSGRIIARLPGPPYQFLDRVVEVTSPPWQMQPGGQVTTEYDVPETEWYLEANGCSGMPFAVLLEIALQPCGWFSAYMGSALHSDTDLSYRNLGGSGTIHRMPSPESGPVRVTVDCRKISHSGGMIIQNFDFRVHDSRGDIYTGDTYFGFFTRTALADQVGIRDERLYKETGKRGVRRPGAFPDDPRLPKPPLCMLDQIALLNPRGGPDGLGFLEGRKYIDPDEWFFKAHFYQDPVWPGSLGLEALIQLVQVYALDRWGDEVTGFEYTDTLHRWTYRGQVIPTDTCVTVQALVTAVDDDTRTVRARGYLAVDGRLIYSMQDFEIIAV